MPNNGTMDQSPQTIEQLQQRYQGLSEQKIKVETQRDSALKQLDELKAQALELYGSDDVEELKKTLDEMKASNEEKRSRYQTSLDAIDEELEAVNETFSAKQAD